MRFSYWGAALVLALSVGFASSAKAQTVPTDSLTRLVNSGQYNFNRLERLSAVGNENAYKQLLPTCGNLQGPSAACSADQFRIFKIAEELMHSANELLGVGPTLFSLRVDNEGLGFALRWTAAEEMSAPGAVSTEFANTQIASVMSRITALRFGASGSTIASASQPRGGSAGADDGELPPSRWGVYLDGGFGYGKRHPTELEDAFAFDSKNFTLGTDYRITPRLILGAMLAHDSQRIDFDSSQSVVSGDMKISGTGVTLYGLYEWEGPYLDLALGWQRMSIDSNRRINYPSFNINVESVNALATGKTNSNNTVGTIDFGWPFNVAALGIDPFIRVEYRNVKIDGFNENALYTSGTRAGMPAGYAFSFADQSLKSTEGIVGIKLQYALKPSFGVVIPYVKAELHNNFDTNPYNVDASYYGQSYAGSEFSLPSDKRVSNYRVYAGGFSMVLPHGWQVFAQYQGTSGIPYLGHHIVSGGVRGEF